MVEDVSQYEPPGPERIRASDADRDAVAHRLRDALAEGRLDLDEHNERLDATYRSKTVGELVPLTEDLPEAPSDTALTTPASGSLRPSRGSERVVAASPTSSSAIAIMGGADRSGDWVLPGNFMATAIMGGIELDLRSAKFTQHETTIWCYPVMGGIGITVPYDVQVRVHGLPIMGGFGLESEAPGSNDPNAPIVHIRGMAIMGGVGVEYRSWKDDGDE
ncbi:DUF1707 SHOCT-like domain-containing protein [Nocardiopsis kunsanensis]|uniref:DUF1707 SHOCT-like domain-containing protein n=1 Tax=Nocardiopsis kunsanensis TaxID=141693 RepID=UPI00034C5227|nr:DUF1707 domain-containing protein [Nocardiopsis kunsanensis]